MDFRPKRAAPDLYQALGGATPAARLRRPGWIILNDMSDGLEYDLGDLQRNLVNDFRVAYRIAEEARYEFKSPVPGGKPSRYYVAHLIPRDDLPRPSP